MRTASRSVGGRVPSRPASLASIVAIFAGRTIDGAGSPAPPRSEMTTSPGQPRCTSLVIIASQRTPWAVCRSPAAMTKAGRRWRTGRSVYGNGTLTMSHGSKFAISSLIGLRRPLVEGRERIIARPPIALRQDDPVTLDAVDKFVPRSQAERGSHGSGDRRLCLAGQLAGNHCSVSAAIVPGQCKEFPYLWQARPGPARSRGIQLSTSWRHDRGVCVTAGWRSAAGERSPARTRRPYSRETAMPQNSPASLPAGARFGAKTSLLGALRKCSKRCISILLRRLFRRGADRLDGAIRFFSLLAGRCPARPKRCYGQAASGGSDIRIASTLPPVFRPNAVPRS